MLVEAQTWSGNDAGREKAGFEREMIQDARWLANITGNEIWVELSPTTILLF